jgi:hypothetical protein
MAIQRQLDELGLIVPDAIGADLDLVESDLTGSRQANTSKKPLSFPPLAARRPSKISTAHSGAPAWAIVLTAGAGNHCDRNSAR